MNAAVNRASLYDGFTFSRELYVEVLAACSLQLRSP
jgi:hypothetical protein